tara:strand:- start:1535 stop:2155 length:621 start_codon:yes stop_codon:yes gene_type:complete
VKLFRTPKVFRWIFPRRIWGFSSSEPKVYLTFDDGPTEGLTDWLIEELSKHDVKATFFCVGENVKRHPNLTKKLIERGHVVANHTMKHEKGTSTSKSEYLASIQETSTLIDSKLFRPPYGRMPWTFTKAVSQRYRIIMWTWLSYDFDESVSVQNIIAQADRIKAGDILVLHDNKRVEERVKLILPEVIRIVKSKGLHFEVIPSASS